MVRGVAGRSVGDLVRARVVATEGVDLVTELVSLSDAVDNAVADGNADLLLSVLAETADGRDTTVTLQPMLRVRSSTTG